MELDELKKVWGAYDAKLEHCRVIQERLLHERWADRARSALIPMQLLRGAEVVLGVAVIIGSIGLLTHHMNEPRYWVVTIGLAITAALITGQCAFSLIQSAAVDYAQPVLQLQSRIQRIKLSEYLALKWTLLLGILAWLPILLVLIECFTGTEALAQVSWKWLAANLLFGLVCLGIGQALSRRYVESSDRSPWAQAFLDSLSGDAYRSILRQLEEIKGFGKSDR